MKLYTNDEIRELTEEMCKRYCYYEELTREINKLVYNKLNLIASLTAAISAISNPHQYTHEMLENIKANCLNAIRDNH